jgi:UDP-GlcNAc3NAcA epimerase
VRTIATIVGARPQFVKAGVVSSAIRTRPDLREVLIHTGQHFDDNMSGAFFRDLRLPEPDHNLGIGGGTHGQNTGRMIEAIEAVLQRTRPDWVLVFGDTDSTLAGALAAAKLHLPVAHVEAGLRSFNRRMPEELNRVLTDHASDLLFVPTPTAVANLEREGIAGPSVRAVGDVMFDAAIAYAGIAAANDGILRSHALVPKGYVLVTVHRAENTDDPERLRGIVEGLGAAAQPIVWPMHPRTRAKLGTYGIELPASVRAIDPVGYLDMINLESNAALIATDSGGVQKEAYFFDVPCVTLRDETEWGELVDIGANRLVGTAATSIAAALAAPAPPVVRDDALFGGGHAAPRIAAALAEA